MEILCKFAAEFWIEKKGVMRKIAGEGVDKAGNKGPRDQGKAKETADPLTRYASLRMTIRGALLRGTRG
jgi:hypothetical protein